jgi:hypothetical protein
MSIALFAGTPAATAAGPASDNAAKAAYNDGWQTGDNGGTDWGGGWTLFETGGNGGYFVGTSQNNGFGDGNIDTGNSTWGIWANGGAAAQATRPFDGTLSIGQSFVIDLDTGFIDSGGSVEFSLSGSGAPWEQDHFSLFFRGGESTYKIATGLYPNSTETDTGVAFTSTGLHVVFTLTGATTYSVALTPAGGSMTVVNGTLANAFLDRVSLYNIHAGTGSPYDAFFNNMSIIPEPTPFALVGRGGVGRAHSAPAA